MKNFLRLGSSSSFCAPALGPTSLYQEPRLEAVAARQGGENLPAEKEGKVRALEGAQLGARARGLLQ